MDKIAVKKLQYIYIMIKLMDLKYVLTIITHVCDIVLYLSHC